MGPQTNPFVFARTASGPSFVNRTAELQSLMSYCSGDANVLLIAPRRLGKSSLIRETFRRLGKKTWLCLYIDVQRCVDDGEVAQAILDELGRTAFGKVKTGWLWLLDQFRRHRPAYTVDPQTGLPSLTLQRTESPLPALEDVLRLIEATARKKKRRAVVAIDEFQTIMERPGSDHTLAVMRSVIQHQSGVAYIFSGSKKHILLHLVEDRENPFWGQLQLLEVSGIPVAEFASFARSSFHKSSRVVDNEVLTRIGQLCEDNPKRIQQILFELYASPPSPKPDDVDGVVWRLVDAERHRFEDLLGEVKEGDQKRLLLALAREGSARAIFGRDFIHRHLLGTASNVQAAARALREKGILNERHHLVDPFFFHFLRGPTKRPKTSLI